MLIMGSVSLDGNNVLYDEELGPIKATLAMKDNTIEVLQVQRDSTRASLEALEDFVLEVADKIEDQITDVEDELGEVTFNLIYHLLEGLRSKVGGECPPMPDASTEDSCEECDECVAYSISDERYVKAVMKEISDTMTPLLRKPLFPSN